MKKFCAAFCMFFASSTLSAEKREIKLPPDSMNFFVETLEKNPINTEEETQKIMKKYTDRFTKTGKKLFLKISVAEHHHYYIFETISDIQNYLTIIRESNIEQEKFAGYFYLDDETSEDVIGLMELIDLI